MPSGSCRSPGRIGKQAEGREGALLPVSAFALDARLSILDCLSALDAGPLLLSTPDS